MEWKRGIITLTLLACLMCVLSYSTVSDDHSRTKRVVFGDILPSHDMYHTQFFINIRRYSGNTNFKAVKLHVPDNTSVGGEQICGGALVHPEYVVTAAHCASWDEVQFKNRIELDAEDVKELMPQEECTRNILRYVDLAGKARVVIKKFDVILSEYVLYAGGTNWFNMTQKRHVRQILPHVASKDPNEGHGGQDISFFRACFPFHVDGANVALAPLDIGNSRARHYDLTRKGAVCLAMGFGAAGWPEWQDELTRWNKIYAHDLRHGWSYLSCASRCPTYKKRMRYLGQNCAICAISLVGHRWHVGTSDSGGPLVCDGVFTGVLNEGADLDVVDSDDYTFKWGHIQGFLGANQSETWFYALHCIKDYLTESHFKYLSEVTSSRDESRIHAEWAPFNPTPDRRTTRKRRIEKLGIFIGRI